MDEVLKGIIHIIEKESLQKSKGYVEDIKHHFFDCIILDEDGDARYRVKLRIKDSIKLFVGKILNFIIDTKTESVIDFSEYISSTPSIYKRDSSLPNTNIQSKKRFSDSEIIDGLRLRGPKISNYIIAQLYQDNKSRIIDLVLSRSGVIEDAQDLLQDVIIQFIENVRSNEISFDNNLTIRNYFLFLAGSMWEKRLSRKLKDPPLESLQYLDEDVISSLGYPTLVDYIEYDKLEIVREIYGRLNRNIELHRDIKKILEMYINKGKSFGEIEKHFKSFSYARYMSKSAERALKIVERLSKLYGF